MNKERSKKYLSKKDKIILMIKLVKEVAKENINNKYNSKP